MISLAEGEWLQRFRERWGHSTEIKPLFVVIGGAAGTGKSHLAAQLSERLPPVTVICTSLIQVILRTTQPEGSILFSHTYDLDIDKYVERCRPIMDSINQLMRFAPSERQLYAVEGSSVVAGLLAKDERVNLVEIYLRVTNPETHRRMLGGPTHDRALTDEQFGRCRAIQEFVTEDAAALGRCVAEFDQGLEAALGLIEESLAV